MLDLNHSTVKDQTFEKNTATKKALEIKTNHAREMPIKKNKKKMKNGQMQRKNKISLNNSICRLERNSTKNKF